MEAKKKKKESSSYFTLNSKTVFSTLKSPNIQLFQQQPDPFTTPWRKEIQPVFGMKQVL